MFGYLVGNIQILSKEDKNRYKAFYCGLCDTLNDRFSLLGRKTLTYDLTFVEMVLNSVYPANEQIQQLNCPLHPLKKTDHTISDFSSYCADMNFYLSYYKYLDDLFDEGSDKFARKTATMKQYLPQIEEKYPQVCQCIQQNLDYISKIEKDNVLDPNLGSDAFGKIMASLFAVKDDEVSQTLSNFGYHLGRFINLMDAVIDLKQDIKKQNYNPLIAMDSSTFEDMLVVIMEECDIFYKQLDLKKDKTILDNVIYSGIWSKYQLAKKKGVVK